MSPPLHCTVARSDGKKKLQNQRTIDSCPHSRGEGFITKVTLLHQWTVTLSSWKATLLCGVLNLSNNLLFLPYSVSPRKVGRRLRQRLPVPQRRPLRSPHRRLHLRPGLERYYIVTNPFKVFTCGEATQVNMSSFFSSFSFSSSSSQSSIFLENGHLIPIYRLHQGYQGS